MTVERYLSASPKDIKKVALVCKKCGAVMGYRPTEWKHVPTKCPNCPIPDGEMHSAGADYASLDGLRETLSKAVKNDNPLFEIRF